ncbi:hypothetical protein C8R45DRAFT_1216659 [Mycena sanguinolenta]|nr:hypothetical protein C8R45DRAFT_1216659 [Mycena sanguinolenta]
MDDYVSGRGGVEPSAAALDASDLDSTVWRERDMEGLVRWRGDEEEDWVHLRDMIQGLTVRRARSCHPTAHRTPSTNRPHPAPPVILDLKRPSTIRPSSPP